MNKFLSTTKTIISKLALLSVLTIASLYPFATSVKANASLAGGDFMQVFNNTTQQGTWTDPISAKPQEIVEFRITAKNTGDQPAEHVQVWGSTTGQVPQGPATQLVITGKIATSSFGGTELTDTATVNVTGGASEGLRYVPGHARLNGVTDKYNCPNTCDIGDNVLGGIDVGTIQPGDFVEVTFKASVTGTPPACVPTTESCTATAPACGTTTTGVNNCGAACTKTGDACVVPPACVSNDTCSVSMPSACGQKNTGVDNCNKACIRESAACSTGGTNITNTNNNTNTNSQSQSVNVTQTQQATGNVGVAAQPQVAGVTTLPKTGLPELAWSALAFVPAGFGLRKFRGIKKTLTDDPNYIWENRQFKS